MGGSDGETKRVWIWGVTVKMNVVVGKGWVGGNDGGYLSDCVGIVNRNYGIWRIGGLVKANGGHFVRSKFVICNAQYLIFERTNRACAYEYTHI